MNINGVSLSNSALYTAAAKKSVQSEPSAQPEVTASAEKVNIRQSLNAHGGTKPLSMPTADAAVSSRPVRDTHEERDFSLPDEAYAVPPWRVHLYVNIDELWGTSGLSAGGVSKHSSYLSASSEEKQEYGALLDKHIRELYSRHGLSDVADRYHALNTIPGLDEKLRDSFRDSVNADERMTALMEKFGFSLT